MNELSQDRVLHSQIINFFFTRFIGDNNDPELRFEKPHLIMAHTPQITTNTQTVVSNEQAVVLKTPITEARLKTIAKKIDVAQTLNHAELIQYNILIELELMGFEIRRRHSDAWKAFDAKGKQQGWKPYASSFPKYRDLDLPKPAVNA